MSDGQKRSVPDHRSSHAAHRIVLFALAILIAALAVASVRMDSATADEGAHVAAGMIKLRHGWLSFFAEQPPLMNVITALPLGGFTLPDTWSREAGKRDHWAVGHALLYESGNDAHRLLFLARLPTIALFLALCFAVWLVVLRETRNETWALVAFALTGFCPNLLAHGRLATVDLGVTFFLFATFALLLEMVRRPVWWMGALAGVAGACAVLSKTSGVIAGPLALIVVALHVARTRSVRGLLLPLLAAAAAALATMYGVTFALASPDYIATAFPETPRLLVPFVQYRQQVDAIGHWYAAGHEHAQFLLGQFSRTGWPHYYLAAFLLKTTLGALILAVMTAAVSIRRRSLAVDASLLFVVLFFAISATSHIALGVRYVLPVYPFLYTAVAVAMSHVVIDRRRALAVGALVAWHCIASVVAWPSYLSYFNELIGSRRNADRMLVDSNLDWGQDLRRLERWTREHRVPFIRIDYFGGGDIAYEFGPRAERWSAPRPQPLPKGWFALSRHFYRVSFDPQESPVDYDTYLELSHARYVTTVGGSIDVYVVP